MHGPGSRIPIECRSKLRLYRRSQSCHRPHYSCTIDGLETQDKNKIGTKRRLSALKEGEKFDVFLARGCGQLSIELYEGVYDKELFQSMKSSALGMTRSTL